MSLLPPRVSSRLAPLLPIVVISALLALVPGTTCLVKLATHRPCPACGFTRATLALAHGELRASVGLHPLVIPFALGTLLAVVLSVALPDHDPRWERFVRVSTTLAALGFIAVWAMRLARVLPPV